MATRKPITPETIAGMAAELAGHPVTPAAAQKQAAVLESVMTMIAGLRALPLKEIEPAPVYRPLERAGEDET